MGQFRPLLAALAALLALGSLCAPARADPGFPALTGRVVDAAGIIPEDEEARLDQKLSALEEQSRRQLVVATVPDLQGYDIADYSNRLFRTWGLGSKERNDGVLLIVAPNERKLRIEVGYGLEGVMTDGLSSLIIQNVVVPRFKVGDMPGGIEAGTDALIQHLSLPEDEARRIAAQPVPASDAGDPTWFPIAFFVFLFVILFVLPALLRGSRDARFRSSGIGNIILWSVVEGLSNASTSSGGGRSSGGGFSGGGGSSGGGGASGSW
ncbi:MAG: YgcG family protein [Novosphingobium sp.]